MPIANHPITPAEMIVSSVILESDGFGLGFESESADFITRSKTPDCQTERMDAEIEQGSCLVIFEVAGCTAVQGNLKSSGSESQDR
jgi:hypothetical protein